VGLSNGQVSIGLSVCPCIRLPHVAAAGSLLWAQRAKDIDRFAAQPAVSTSRVAANSGSATLSADVQS